MRNRRYCSVGCRQHLRQKLTTRTGLLEALNVRHATFYFTSEMIVLDLLQGALPVFMLLGGALAIYVGFDEMHDKIRQERQRQSEELEKAREEIETARAEAGRYREELDRLKKDAQEAVPGIRK